MRLACGLAIALWLSFPAAGMARQQEPAGGAANSAGQAPAAPAPRENAPAEATPAPAKKASAKAATKKADAGAAGPGAAKTGAAKTRSASGTRKHRQRTAPAPDGAPRKIVVREGGASEPAAQIVPGMTPAEATRQRQNAERLLGATGDQLKQLAGRPLDPQRQETVEQIRNYMEGARSALKEGDVQRASTLAEKAHLLAEDLVKH
jgi:hypothetical protein